VNEQRSHFLQDHRGWELVAGDNGLKRLGRDVQNAKSLRMMAVSGAGFCDASFLIASYGGQFMVVDQRHLTPLYRLDNMGPSRFINGKGAVEGKDMLHRRG